MQKIVNILLYKDLLYKVGRHSVWDSWGKYNINQGFQTNKKKELKAFINPWNVSSMRTANQGEPWHKNMM